MNPGTVLLLGLLVLLYLNFVGRRRAVRQRDAVQRRVVPGAEVVTTSGLHATVSELHDDGTVTLLTGPGQVSRWEQPAVGRVLTSPADDVPAADPVAPAVEPVAEPVVERRDAHDAHDTAPPDRA